MKTIAFFSFGHQFPEDYPKAPAENAMQIILETRILEDPWKSGKKESGLDKATQINIQKDGYDFFSSIKPPLLKLAGEWLKNPKYETFNIYFGCSGGYQRSVASAEYFKSWVENVLRSESKNISITIKHLSLRRWEKKL